MNHEIGPFPRHRFRMHGVEIFIIDRMHVVRHAESLLFRILLDQVAIRI